MKNQNFKFKVTPSSAGICYRTTHYLYQ